MLYRSYILFPACNNTILPSSLIGTHLKDESSIRFSDSGIRFVWKTFESFFLVYPSAIAWPIFHHSIDNLGDLFLRINLATDITSLISPPFCHICEPINLLRPELSFGNTFSEIPRNWASVYLDKKSFLNLDCKGFDNRPSSLAVANTLQLFISKSYWRFIWSTLIRPLSKKLSSFSWNCFGILSNSSKRIILGLFSSRISSILLVVLLPSKKTVVMALFPSLWLLYI